ncbi:hypothetical protein GGF32_007235 [Allomyces javanicus]|nr:hypothetical protein GGF32_007235 [Allomyces javanicus]
MDRTDLQAGGTLDKATRTMTDAEMCDNHFSSLKATLEFLGVLAQQAGAMVMMLYKVAWDFARFRGTIVDAKQSFSIAGHILTKRMSNLSDAQFEAQQMGEFKSTVHNLLLDLYLQPRVSQHTLRHFVLDRDLIARLKQLAVDVAVGFLEHLGRFTKVTAQQERERRTDKSNAIYFDMAVDHPLLHSTTHLLHQLVRSVTYYSLLLHPAPAHALIASLSSLSQAAGTGGRCAERRDRGILDASSGTLTLFDPTLTVDQLLTDSVL